MIRRTLKDKEIDRVSMADINNMAVGDILSVYVCSPIQNGDYLLGYNGNTLSCKDFGTAIESQEAEYTYREDKIPTNNNLIFNIRKFDDGLTFSREILTQITEIPNVRVHRVILTSNNYYIGVNGSSYITTKTQSEAMTDSRYWWDFNGPNANATVISLYNPTSGRYMDYQARGPRTTTDSIGCYCMSSNLFKLGQNGQGNCNMLTINTSGTLNNSTKSKFDDTIMTGAWTVYSLDVSPNTQGAVTWMYPMTYTINTFTPSGNTLLAGNKSDIFRFSQNSSYLKHGANAAAGLSASTTGTDINAAWILYKIN